MVAMKTIMQFSRQIADRFGAQRIVLFGSYAQGTANADSDVDLLIIMPHEGRSVDESVKIRLALKPPFPVDLLVRTVDSVNERLALGDVFLKDILENGKVLYATDHN